MKTSVLFLCVLIICLAVLVQGCHRAKKLKPKRFRRDANVYTQEEEENHKLIQFFTDCLSRVLSRLSISIPAVVKFAISDTKWFAEGDLLYCNGEKDTDDCWEHLMPFLIDKKSVFYYPTRYCVLRYSSAKALERGRKKRSLQDDFYVFLGVGNNFKKFLIFLSKNKNNPRYNMVNPYKDINVITDFIEQVTSNTNRNNVRTTTFPQTDATTTIATTMTTTTMSTTTTVKTTTPQLISMKRIKNLKLKGMSLRGRQLSATLDESNGDECLDFRKYYQCTKQSENLLPNRVAGGTENVDELKSILSFVWKHFSRCSNGFGLPKSSAELKERRCIVNNREDDRMDGKCISDLILEKIVMPSSPLMPVLRSCKPVDNPAALGRAFDGSVPLFTIFEAKPCNGTWTRWYNTFNPKSKNGDFETLWRTRMFDIDKVCESPTSIDVQFADGRPLKIVSDVLEITNSGLCCENARQSTGICNDYAVRFCC